jgi:hypothetical protein
MGDLSRKADGLRHPLAAETLVGRSRGADLWIADEFVSGHHSTISWSGSEWSVRDLGSRNGTEVNGEALAAGSVRSLANGDQLTFGDPSATWRVVDVEGPQPLAVSPDRVIVAGADGLLALPGIDAPWATVFRTPDGSWRLESPEEMRPVRDRDAITVDGDNWIVRLPDSVTSTGGAQALRLAAVDLEVRVADDDNTAALHVRRDTDVFSFPLGSTSGVMRALAQARASDEQGWVERGALLHQLTVSANHLNVMVFRLRRQFADAGFGDSASIIERDRSRLRLGTNRVTVTVEQPRAPDGLA